MLIGHFFNYFFFSITWYSVETLLDFPTLLRILTTTLTFISINNATLFVHLQKTRTHLNPTRPPPAPPNTNSPRFRRHQELMPKRFRKAAGSFIRERIKYQLVSRVYKSRQMCFRLLYPWNSLYLKIFRLHSFFLQPCNAVV